MTTFTRTPLPSRRLTNGFLFPSRLDFCGPVECADQLLVDRIGAGVQLTVSQFDPITHRISLVSLLLNAAQARVMIELLSAAADEAERS